MTAFANRKPMARLLAGSAVAVTMGLAMPAYAQTQNLDNDEGATFEDLNSQARAADDNVITVTARRQTESLQDVPVTVTAIAGDSLEKFNIDQIQDVVSRVPSLNVQVGGSGSGGQISLRGVGSSNISAAFDSAVAFDFDGIQVSTMRIVQAGFFDVEQIDVLKGPQSLFFGKSASAGVLSIRSANPTNQWEFGAKGSYEFEEKGYIVSGFASGPVTDTFGIRVAAQFNDIEDYNELQAGTPAVNQDRGIEEFIGRITLDWQPTDGFSANLKVNYVDISNDGANAFTEVDCGANGLPDPVFLLGGAIAIPPGYDCDTRDQRYFFPDTSPALAQQIPAGSAAAGPFDGVPFGSTEILFGRLRFDVDFTDYLTLSSVSGYLDLDAIDYGNYAYGGIGPAFSPTGAPVAAIAPALAAVNFPGSAQGTGASDPTNQIEQFAQELRLTSDLDGAFNFMVGAFYETRELTFNTAQQAVNISLIAPDPVTGNTFDYRKIHNTKTEAISFFGSATLQIGDRLELAGGVRYTTENKTQVINIPYVHTLLSSGPAFVQSGFFSGPIDFSDDNLSPEASIRYELTDDVNIYGAFKTGFKSGGIDNSALPSSSLLGFGSPDPAVRQATANSLIFESETGLGGEIGIKSQFMGRTLTLNATAYYYVFDDLQVQNFNAQTIQFVTTNAGELTTQGVDLEFGYITPIEGLSLSGSLSYLDAEFTDTFVFNGIDLEGRDGARAPTFSGNLAFDWEIPLGRNLQLGLNGNALYSDGYLTNTNTVEGFPQDSYVTLDGAISVGHPDGLYKFSLIGVNLTDKIYDNTSSGRPFLAPPNNPFGVREGDDVVVTQNRGRQVFVEASFRF